MIEKRTFGGIVADIIIWIIVGALALSCLMPLMNIVAISPVSYTHLTLPTKRIV